MDKETILDLIFRRLGTIEFEADEIRKLLELMQKEQADADH